MQSSQKYKKELRSMLAMCTALVLLIIAFVHTNTQYDELVTGNGKSVTVSATGDPAQTTQPTQAAQPQATQPQDPNAPTTAPDPTATAATTAPTAPVPTGAGKMAAAASAMYSAAYAKTTTTTAPPPDNSKYAYLTFDDGPTANTRQILDILDRYNVKATFFVIYHQGVDDLYKAIIERGHTLAIHSYTHEYGIIYKSDEAFYGDIEKMTNYVTSVTGTTPSKIFRFPGGSSNTISRKYNSGIMSRLTKGMEAKGYKYFDWNVDSGDADGTRIARDRIVSNVRNRLGTYKHAVLLMHDASAKTTTVEALPEIIQILIDGGYSIRPLTETTPPCHHTVNN